MSRIPKYAQGVDPTLLVQMLCKGTCTRMRWARLNKHPPSRDALKKAAMREYVATCLKCGREMLDNYNWIY